MHPKKNRSFFFSATQLPLYVFPMPIINKQSGLFLRYSMPCKMPRRILFFSCSAINSYIRK